MQMTWKRSKSKRLYEKDWLSPSSSEETNNSYRSRRCAWENISSTKTEAPRGEMIRREKHSSSERGTHMKRKNTMPARPVASGQKI